MSNSNDILRLENAQKWVGTSNQRVDILRGLSFSVHSGEFVAVMGPSGSGKSTLLNLVGLLDIPSAGTVFFEGQDISALDEDALASIRAQRLGFIFQSFNLLPYLNVRQNIELPLSYSGKPHQKAPIDGLLNRVGLTHRKEAFPTTLSGGERQRVAIARALANNPSLILADEPTGALDSKTGQQIMALLSELNHQGVTILLITHDESIARRSHRILQLRDGRLD